MKQRTILQIFDDEDTLTHTVTPSGSQSGTLVITQEPGINTDYGRVVAIERDELHNMYAAMMNFSKMIDNQINF